VLSRVLHLARRIITPLVSGIVVMIIGLSLIQVGLRDSTISVQEATISVPNSAAIMAGTSAPPFFSAMRGVAAANQNLGTRGFRPVIDSGHQL
jgi:xanthine/uracil permease